MGGSLEAFKLFTASEKKRQERAEQILAQAEAEKKQASTGDDTREESTSSRRGEATVHPVQKETNTTMALRACN